MREKVFDVCGKVFDNKGTVVILAIGIILLGLTLGTVINGVLTYAILNCLVVVFFDVATLTWKQAFVNGFIIAIFTPSNSKK